MTSHESTKSSSRKWILLAVGLPILVALWWAFRPEKLWINQKVDEPAPSDVNDAPQPLLTGQFESQEGHITGRATVFEKPGGERYLRLNVSTNQNVADIHVLLVRREGRTLARDAVNGDFDRVDLGPLKSNQGNQNYDLSAATDVNKYNVVVIYSDRSHMMYGSVKLEPF